MACKNYRESILGSRMSCLSNGIAILQINFYTNVATYVPSQRKFIFPAISTLGIVN